MEPEPARFRLSVMMLGQYLIMGAWLVTLATFLKSLPPVGGLLFPPFYVGLIYSTTALAGIIAPFFTGLLADRLFRSDRLMVFFHLTGGLLLLAIGLWTQHRQSEILRVYTLLAQQQPQAKELLSAYPSNRLSLEEQLALRETIDRMKEHPDMVAQIDTTFYPMLALMTGFAFCTIFSVTLSNVVAMRNLKNPAQSFSKVRLYGTIGWIVSGFMVELFLKAISPAPLYFASIASLLLGLFCLWLPSTPPKGEGKSMAQILGLPALKLFQDRGFTIFIFSSFLLSITQQFYGVYANAFLNELRAPYPAALQTMAQITEVFCMASIPWLLPKVGMKGMMLLGIGALFFRNGLFVTESLGLVIILGLPLHGLSYAFYYVVASIYVDRMAPVQLRASVQGIFTFITMGSGTLIGNWLSSRLVQLNTSGDHVEWEIVWLIPTLLCGVITAMFWVGFQMKPTEPKSISAPTNGDEDA